MFFFESIPWYSAIMWFVVLGALIGLNQLARMSKIVSFTLFLIIPAVLTFTVWPKTAASGSSVGTWFAWAKVYSSLAGCLGFMAIRYVDRFSKNKFMLMFPPLILSLNILEAVIREFQLFSNNGFLDGMIIVGGPWNIFNGVAGLLNIITLSGWVGIIISKDKHKDMVWPDQLWFWVIAYDLWNFAYVYNCVPDHAFYAGAALLISCTIPAFFIKKGVWLQHRAQTLGIWMTFVMTFPAFVDTSKFAVKSSHNVTALWIIALLSFGSNVAVFVYHFAKIAKYKRNPLTQEVHFDLKSYQTIKAENM